ncbi:MAG: methyltransferase domain-containing protein [Spirochaetales bacterium]|nr:methyltransferase domain-containing protein [Spirochaetales bacterium]
MDTSAQFWDKSAGSYDRRVMVRYKKTYRDTVDLSKRYLKGEHTLLDFACGTGIVTVELAGCVKKINAIDISGRMIAIAKRKAVDHSITNITFEVTDIFDTRFDGKTFDAVCAFNILYFIEDSRRVLDRIRELLPPSGLFISATDCTGEKKSIVTRLMSLLSKAGLIPYFRPYSIAELEEHIKTSGFSIIESGNLYEHPPNRFIVAVKNA